MPFWPSSLACRVAPWAVVAYHMSHHDLLASREASVAEVSNRLAADGNGQRIKLPARASKLVLRPSPDANIGAGIITLDVAITVPGR